MLRLFAALLGLLSLSASLEAATPVVISDVIQTPVGGRPGVGSITVSWPSFVEPDQTVVPSGSQNVTLSPTGAFSLSLYPTDQATLPGSSVLGSVYYTAVYNLTTGQSIKNLWTVPTTTATLKLTNVLAPISGWLRAPIGTTTPTHCTPGDLFVNQATQAEQVCVATDTWINLVNLSQAGNNYLADSKTAGLVYRNTQASDTRKATANDLTTTLGYIPPNPANALSEYSGNLTGVYTALGLKSAATHLATDFLLAGTVIPLNLIPTDIPTSSIVNYGVGFLTDPGQSGFVFRSTAAADTRKATAADLTALLGYTPPNPANSLSEYSSNLTAVYAALGLKSAATHLATDFLSASAVIPLSLLPTNIPASSIVGLGSGPNGAYLTTSQLGANNGVAQLSNTGQLLVNELPPITYSMILNVPTPVTKISQLLNDSGYALLTQISTVGRTGSYTDLTNKPSFDAQGAAAAALAQAFQIANALSELSTSQAQLSARSHLGLSPLAASGNWADVSGKPATFPADWNALTNRPTFGTIITKNTGDYVATAVVGAANGVAPLDGSGQVPLLNLPGITPSKIIGFPAVVTTGSYTDLLNKPPALPPNGAAGGDLCLTFPNPVVCGLNGINLAQLANPSPAGGIVALNHAGVPHLAGNTEITAGLGFTPLNPSLALGEISNQALARSHLGIGPIATANITDYLADPGNTGLPFRTTPGVTRTTTSADLSAILGPNVYDAKGAASTAVAGIPVSGSTQTQNALISPADWSTFNNKQNALGFTPQNTAQKNQINGYPGLDNNGLILLSELPPIPDPALTGDVTKALGSSTTTLATVNSAPGACGDATHVCQVVVDAKGRVTTQAPVPITGAGNSGNGNVTGSSLTLGNFIRGAGASTIADSGKAIPTGNVVGDTDVQVLTNKAIAATELTSGTLPVPRLPAFTGDVSSAAGTSVLNLITVNSGFGACGDATHVCRITTDANGRTVTQTAVAIAATGSGNITGSSLVTGNVVVASGPSAVADSGLAAPTSAIVGVNDAQTLNNKSISATELTGGTIPTARMPALSGDVISAAGTTATALAPANNTPGACGDATHVCQVTTDAKGRVTAQTAVGITAGGTGTVTNTTGVLASGRLIFGNGGADLKTGDLTGDVTTSGSPATVLTATGVTAGTYGDASNIPRVTVDGKGRVTAITTFAAQGGGGSGGTAAVPYAQSFTSVASVTLAHGLNSQNVSVTCYDTNNQAMEPGSVVLSDANDALVSFAGPRSGKCLVFGGAGTAPGSFAFSSQTSLTITHNLHTQNVITACYDANNTLLAPANLTIVDANTVTVGFVAAQSGRCVINGSVGPQGSPAVGGGGTAQHYTFALTGATGYTIPAATHGLNSASLSLSCKDSTGAQFDPGTFQVDPTTYTVNVNFAAGKPGGACSLF